MNKDDDNADIPQTPGEGMRGGMEANSGHGWGVSQTPYGPIYHYDPNKFGGTHSGGSGSGQGRPGSGGGNKASVAIPFSLGGPFLAETVTSQVTLTLSRFTLAQPVVKGVAALAASQQLVVEAAVLWAVTTTPLAPGTLEPTFINVMNADKLLGSKINDLAADVKALTLSHRVVDMVQDGQQKIAVVKGLPDRIPVVEAKTAGQFGKFWVSVPGVPVVKLELETVAKQRPGAPVGLREEKTPSVCTPPLACGLSTIDVLVRFPSWSGRKPMYLSAIKRMNKGSLAEREKEEQRRQQAWLAAHPYEAAVREWEEVKRELAAAQAAYHNAQLSGNAQAIAAALAEVKAKEQKEKKAKEETEAAKRRKAKGKASGKGKKVGEKWLWEAGKELGAPVPDRIADKLRGKTFNGFDDFRRQFWIEVSKDPELNKQFKPRNQGRIKKGLAPRVAGKKNRAGKRSSFELHHNKPIKDDGAVFDMDNLTVVTPKRHIELHNGEKTMNRKTHITQFTEAEFYQLTKDVCESNGDEQTQDDNYQLFDTIVEHPEGADLIFWPEHHDGNPDDVIKDIKEWYKANNKPCFRKE